MGDGRRPIYDGICPECQSKMTLYAGNGPIGFARCDDCGFNGPVFGELVVPPDVKRRGNVMRQERYWPEVVDSLRNYEQLQ